MIVIDNEQWPIKMWLDKIEDGAMKQARNLANLPFLHKWVALMPDAHQGFGMPIGGVIACKDHIIPNAVGVDIGCGMCAVKTSLETIQKNHLINIISDIRKTIPTGFSHHKKPQDENNMPSVKKLNGLPIIKQQFFPALHQLGTLGGGNHFIEIQKGSDGNIWLMIHSGSRNIGKQVADHYNKLAIKCQYPPILQNSWQLAHLPLSSNEGQAYLQEMNYCVAFAFENRKLMMDRCVSILQQHLDCSVDPMINIAHNYASLETHYQSQVMVHRKGATKAFKETIGIIPGSMGSSSFIVKGLGHPESFMSCSHGAGRKMGRKEAIRSLSLSQEQEKMKHIIGKPTRQDELEEAPGAYKDIHDVMAQQKDLVEILVKLEPLAVIKG